MVDEITLEQFKGMIGSNIGYSIPPFEKKNEEKPKTYDPFSALNHTDIKEVFNVMCQYKDKTHDMTLGVPNKVSVSKNGEKTKFEFTNGLNPLIMNEILADSNYSNLKLNKNEKIIELKR